MTQERNESLRTDSIRPTFRGVFLERFLHLVECVDALPPLRQREAVCRELDWVRGRTGGGDGRLKYGAMLMVLRDLLGQGWRLLFRQRSIFLTRPEYTRGRHEQLDPATVKNLIREAFRDERLAQLAAPAAARFIRAMETPRPPRQSIHALIADGGALARDLARLPEQVGAADARRVIDPYLHLIAGEERDGHTGLKLIDAWRYFRYLWTIPYQPTPGRNLYYLIRDAARPCHPVIGIAALGNSVVQMGERDKAIGWSLDGVEARLKRRQREIVRDLPKSSPVRTTTVVEYLESEAAYRRRVRQYAERLADTLLRALEAEQDLINPDRLATPDELAHPTPEVIRRLFAQAEDYELERQEGLRLSHREGLSPRRTEGVRAWKEDSDSPLYRKKRALALAEVLQARHVLQAEGLAADPLPTLERLLQTEDGRRAIRVALHANKKTKIGSSIMDIIICGAIPPYAELLGGKLVAMLMASPQVVAEYRARYQNQTSEIASRLAARPVIRPAELVFLGTTSLYHVGSSQYERIRIPGPRGGHIAYECLGHTEGYGSTLLSSETVDVLRDLIGACLGMQRVNNIFGEGVSPRLRLTREGLALLGIPQGHVLKHSCPRLIYGVRLARNAFEYRRGKNRPPGTLSAQAERRRSLLIGGLNGFGPLRAANRTI
jgi:hypothetical protein